MKARDGVGSEGDGGQECPRSVCDGFFDIRGEIEVAENRLPHWQQDGKFLFVTWRLADSLPREKLVAWAQERASWVECHPEPWDDATEEAYHARFSRRIDEWLDEGLGSCVLRDPGLACCVADAIKHFDGVRYDLVSFVVMPNHVHTLFRLMRGHSIGSILRSWKGYTARVINRRIQRSGALWQEDYWDRLIRNSRHFSKCIQYIRRNPDRAGLLPGEYLLWERNGSNGAGTFESPD